MPINEKQAGDELYGWSLVNEIVVLVLKKWKLMITQPKQLCLVSILLLRSCQIIHNN